MKAAQLVKFKQDYEINEVPVPKVGDHDLLVKIGAAGYCHTDYQVWEGVYESPLPIIPSHEPVGTIIAVGPKVEKWKVGQRVGVGFIRHQCHDCTGCKVNDDIRWCDNKELGGLKNDGGIAEYMIGDDENVVLLPDSLSFEQAAPLMCAGATVYNGILATGLKPGQPIGIVGIGGLGTLGVQFAKALGYRVVAIDNRPEGRDLATAMSLKADLVVDYNDEGALKKIKDFAGDGGLPGIVVSTDSVPASAWSLKTLRPHGVCVPLGLPVAGFEFDAFLTVFQALTIKGSLVASMAQIRDMLDVVDKFGIRSHLTTIPLEKVSGIAQMYMDPHLKGRLVVKLAS